ncbi:hypothetical protein F905_02997 [Acinetobacter sp. CIP 53.82]|nr:hypothetical protein F905_02997 [Acinetobacter sp. CIP 53.82]
MNMISLKLILQAISLLADLIQLTQILQPLLY